MQLEKRTQVLEMRSYRRLFNISYKDHVTNDELLTLVKKRNLMWFSHVTWSSGKRKTSLQDTVKVKKKRQTEEEVGRY